MLSAGFFVPFPPLFLKISTNATQACRGAHPTSLTTPLNHLGCTTQGAWVSYSSVLGVLLSLLGSTTQASWVGDSSILTLLPKLLAWAMKSPWVGEIAGNKKRLCEAARLRTRPAPHRPASRVNFSRRFAPRRSKPVHWRQHIQIDFPPKLPRNPARSICPRAYFSKRNLPILGEKVRYVAYTCNPAGTNKRRWM